MERVVNSVQQIVRECESMLAKTEDCEYVDIKSLAKTLTDECNDLKEFFERFPDKTLELSAKKQTVENTAIRLEFYMCARLNLYEDRYKLRKSAGVMYDDCKRILCRMSVDKEANRDELLYWGTKTKWALSFYGRSLHILFEISDEDEKIIEEIINKMRKLKEDINYAW